MAVLKLTDSVNSSTEVTSGSTVSFWSGQFSGPSVCFEYRYMRRCRILAIPFLIQTNHNLAICDEEKCMLEIRYL